MDWVVDGVSKRIGNGSSIVFWKDIWFGRPSLEELFPQLFAVSSLQNEVISAFGR